MSLRLRLTFGLVLVNAVVLGALFLWAADRMREAARPQEQRARELQVEVARLVQASIQPEDVGNLARMLSWPLWSEFEDALILDTRVLDNDGRPQPVGVFLNPKGSLRRAADFQLEEVTATVVLAARSGASIPVAGGVAMPLYARQPFEASRQAWGGLFIRLVAPVETPSLLWRALLIGAGATALGAALIYLLLDRSVLRPVLGLAEAAGEFGRGRAPTVVSAASAAPEVRALSNSFAAMMEEIRGFQRDLEQRVAEATARAMSAERHATRQDRLAALGLLAAGLAHEINSPLAGALHSLEALRKEAEGDRALRSGALVEEALQRIRELVQRLLQMAPHQAIGGTCALDEVAADLRVFLSSRLARHRLLLDFPEPGRRVSGARGDWFPLLLNLVQNALDALDADQDRARAGTVRLSARTGADQGSEIRVSDDGPGAPPDLLPHLFEPFVTSKDPGHGTGLGLALAHAAVRALGGEIEAANLPGGGFEVLIRVPAPNPAG